jgi:aspartate aminotransferase
MDYPLYLAHLGLGCDLVASDRQKRLDLTTIEQAWTSHTKGILVSQPTSPTGVVHTQDELAALANTLDRLGRRHGQPPILISDETHRDQIWAREVAFHTPLTWYRNAISVYSFGKAWQMQGQRTGYLAIHPEHPRQELLHRMLTAGLRITGAYGPTALMQHLAAELADHIPNLGPLRDLQQQARVRLREARYDVVGAHATPFVYIRVPDGDETAFTTLLARRGVLVMPSTVFHERGYVRIAINTRSQDLATALDILAEHSAGATYG